MMMDILMYLFETYIHSDAELQVNQDELEEELIRAGFHQKISTKPLSGWKIWLHFNKVKPIRRSPCVAPRVLRVFTHPKSVNA